MTHPRTPDDLQQFIDANQIQAQLIREIGDTPTVPAAAAALGVESGRIIKTLLFLVRNPAEKEAPPLPVLVISNGESRIEKGFLTAHFGVGKNQIKLAPADVVLEKLGFPAGGVPPFGHHQPFPALLDASVTFFEGESIVYGGGGDDRTMLALTVNELIRVTQPAAIIPLS
jgi:prolyl-tRNA editing enzyme YbaK/EbsC (Cys-tRNA(Pro) deacylase)